MEILRQAVKRDRSALVLVRSLKPTINWNTKAKSLALKTQRIREGQSTYEFLGRSLISKIYGEKTW